VDGLELETVQVWSQNTGGIADGSEDGDQFGFSLAVGNIGFDAADDLAIGAPYEDIGSADDAGAVHVLFGVQDSGLQDANNKFFTQNSYQVADSSQDNDLFGLALVAGNFGYTGRADLAISAPGESFGTVTHGGAVHVLYGYSGGLKTDTSQYWTQDSTGVAETAESLDMFGMTLARGDFNGNGYHDLAIGVPHEGIGALSQVGVVHVFYGDANGIATVDQLYRQGVNNVVGSGAAFDMFGWGLAAADIKTSGTTAVLDDLVVGSIGDTVGSAQAAGTFTFLNGHVSGDLGMFTQVWSQNSSSVEDDAQAGEAFGYALCPGDFDGDGTIDVAVGVPAESVNGFTNAGAINIIESRSVLGLTGDEGRFITQ
jgi:hypothetical protein